MSILDRIVELLGEQDQKKLTDYLHLKRVHLQIGNPVRAIRTANILLKSLNFWRFY